MLEKKDVNFIITVLKKVSITIDQAPEMMELIKKVRDLCPTTDGAAEKTS